jgi:lipoprotein-anchoring transpeptidase ErfK/SrfK
MLSTSIHSAQPNSQRRGHFLYAGLVATLLISGAIFLFARPDSAHASINPEITNTQVGQEVVQRVLPRSIKKTVTLADPADTSTPDLTAPQGMDTPLSSTSSTSVAPRQALPRQINPNPLNRRVVVDLSEQRVYAMQGDTVVFTDLISSGSTFPSPVGTFRIFNRVRSELMAGRDYYLPNVEFTQYFTKAGHALHGTYWHSNFGHPMSHGCINMRNSTAKWFWDWAGNGTIVHIRH